MNSQASHRVAVHGFETGDFGFNTPGGGAQVYIQGTNVRTGNYSLQVNPSSGTKSYWEVQFDELASAVNTVFYRGYLYISSLPSTSRAIVSTSTLTADASNLYLHLNPTGTLTVKTGSTTRGTSTTALSTGTWYLVEWGLNGTNAVQSLKIDNVTEIGWVTGVTFSAVASLYLGAIDTVASTFNLFWDDVAVDCRSWCGPGQITMLKPNGVGTLTVAGFTVTGAATKWQALTDANDATSYVTTDATTTSVETYTFEDLPGPAVAARGINVHIKGRQNGVNPSTYYIRTNLGGFLGVSSGFSAGPTWDWHSDTVATSTSNRTPVGGSWTKDRINDLEIGIQAGDATATSDITFLGVEVDYDDRAGAPEGVGRLYVDSFERGDLTDWTITGTGVSLTTTQARTGTRALRLNPSAARSYARTNITFGVSEAFIKFSFWGVTLPTSGNTMRIMNIGSQTTLAGALALVINDTGKFRLEDSVGLVGSGFSSTGITTGAWNTIEVRCRFSTTSSATDGIGEVRLNGSQIIAPTSIKTVTTSGYILQLGSTQLGTYEAYYDDLVVDSNSWIGDAKVMDVVPTGVGSHPGSGWSVTGSAAGWSALDETTANDNTDYVSTTTTTSLPNNTQSYATGDMGVNAYVNSVTVLARAARNGTQNGSITIGYSHPDGYIISTSNNTTSSTTYAWFRRTQSVGEGFGCWTVTSVDGGELTLRNSSANVSRITFLRAMVDYLDVVTVQGTKEVTSDAYVVSLTQKDFTADAIVLAETPKNFTADGSVTGEYNKDFDGTGIVTDVMTLDMSSDALVLVESNLEVTSDGSVAGEYGISYTADGYVSEAAQVDRDITADAVVFVSDQTIQFSSTSILQDTFNKDFTTDAFMATAVNLDFTTDAVVIDSFLVNKDFTADAEAIEAYLNDKQFIATAIVINSTVVNKDIATDAVIINSLAISKSFTADGIIQFGPEFTADAIVTNSVGSGLIVSWADLDAASTITWRLVEGERIDGTVYVDPIYLTPHEFVAGHDYSAQGVGIAINTGVTGDFTVTFERYSSGWNVLKTIEVNGDLWSDLVDGSMKAGWFMFQFNSTVPITSGDRLRVNITGTGLVVATKGTTEGFTGKIPNCFIVTEDTPASIDGRTAIVLTIQHSNDTVRNTRTLPFGGAIPALDKLYISPGAEVVLKPTENINLTVGALNVAAGGQLSGTPNSGISHNLTISSVFSIQGIVTLTGQSKTRYAILDTATVPTGTTLSLSSPPTGWNIGDRLYVASSNLNEGHIVSISNISSTLITLDSSVGLSSNIGSYVTNITRSVSIRGISPQNRSQFVTNKGSNITLNHVELRSIGQGSTIWPQNSTVSLDDCVISELRLIGNNDGPSAIHTGGTLTINDLTVVRCRHALIIDEDLTITGETVIMGTAVSGAITNTAILTADIIASDIYGSVIALSGNGQFFGDITNKFAKGFGGLIVAGGMANHATITGGLLSSVAGETTQALYLPAGTGLGRLSITGFASDAPWVRLAPGAFSLGDGEMIECTNTADYLVVNNSNSFISLKDEDNITSSPVTGTGTILYGSSISNRYTTVEATGRHEKEDTIVWVGDSSLKLTATAGTHRVELTRIPLTSGGSVIIRAILRGSGVFRVGSTYQSVSTGTSWQTVDLMYSSAVDTVVIVSVETDTTLYVDGVVRL